MPRIGLFLGPALALAVYFLVPRGMPLAGLSESAVAVAALGALMVVWWVTEAIPAPATSLLPIPFLPLLGVCSTKDAAAPYGSDIIYLFLGGFLLGEAMQRWNLHKRLALHVLRLVGNGPARLVLGFMLLSCGISMWVSNTATTLMLVPLGLSVVHLTRSGGRDGDNSPPLSPAQRNFATCIVLAIAYGASIGGVGTLIGTPPNLVLAGTAEKLFNQELTVGYWMRLGVPIVLVMGPLAWAYLAFIAFPLKESDGSPLRLSGERAFLNHELRTLGRMSRPERIVLAVFLGVALAWVFRPLLLTALNLRHALPGGKAIDRLDDAGIAVLGALALFLIPAGRTHPRRAVLDWKTAERLPWGILLFFGGSLSLADAMTRTGVDQFLGSLLAGLGHIPTALVVLLVIAAVVFLTEVASNVAVASALMPIMAAAAGALHVHPYLLMFPACLAASLAFMLPVGTPPNAIVYATGQVSMRQMIRAGFRLNLLSIATIFVMVYVLGSLLLGEDLMTPPEWAKSP